MPGIELPHEIEAELEELALRSGLSKAQVVEKAMRQFLDEEGDLKRAAERLSAPQRRWSLEDLEAGRDLEG